MIWKRIIQLKPLFNVTLTIISIGPGHSAKKTYAIKMQKNGDNMTFGSNLVAYWTFFGLTPNIIFF